MDGTLPIKLVAHKFINPSQTILPILATRFSNSSVSKELSCVSPPMHRLVLMEEAPNNSWTPHLEVVCRGTLRTSSAATAMLSPTQNPHDSGTVDSIFASFSIFCSACSRRHLS